MLEALIVADDLTGAAEMAGIGVDYGLPGELARETAGDVSGDDVLLLAVDSDTRHLARDAAGERLAVMLEKPPSHRFFYKKTDSVLRGHIVAELSALMKIFGKRRAILLAQNPSKGRVIAGGQYLIDGVPLEQTDFRHDPEYPCATSRVNALLAGDRVSVVAAGAALPPEGIIVAEAASAADVQWWAERADDRTLLAGGADFLNAALQSRQHHFRPVPVDVRGQEVMVVCGSACDYSRRCVAGWQKQNLPLCPMPDALFKQPHRSPSPWHASIATALRERAMAIVAVCQPADPGRASIIRGVTADTVHRVLISRGFHTPLQLYVEGGATAAAIAHALRWTTFAVKGNLAPGVVAMQPHADPHMTLIIKPGSYPWPESMEALGHA